jgi:hypothetical protein
MPSLNWIGNVWLVEHASIWRSVVVEATYSTSDAALAYRARAA